MKKVTIGICLCLFLIFVLIACTAFMIIKVGCKLKRSACSLVVLPLFVLASLLSRSYHHIDALVFYVSGDAWLTSRCEYAFVSGLPSWLEMIALCINLAIWVNFVLSSLARLDGDIQKYASYRT